MNTKMVLLALLAIIVLGGAALFVMGKTPMNQVADNGNTGNQSPTQGNTNDGQNQTPTTTENTTGGENPAVTGARADLASKLKISTAEVTVLDVVAREWTDGCLGLGGPAESCIAMITPGYIVTMKAKGKTYIYRTNTEGTSVRAETKI